MRDMDEYRVYDDRREETVAYLATGQGVATVRVASDRVGQFALAHTCQARDIAASGGQVYVATDECVLVGPGEFEALGFDGGAVAVAAGAGDADDADTASHSDASDARTGSAEAGASDAGLLAADESGGVFRFDGDGWVTVGTVPSIRALSGDFVAASDGVYRAVGGELRNVGLDDVRDVATGGAPLAATGDGLYRLGNGWLREHDGRFVVVATDSVGQRSHAATDGTLYVRGGAGVEDGWAPVDLPASEPVVDVAYGECVYTVTEEGTFLVEADPDRTADGTGGWRSRALGLPDVTAVAVA